MKQVILFICLSLLCIYAQNAPNVTITGWAYFDNIVGSAHTVLCRATDEIQYGGPTQNPCTQYGYPVPPTAQGRWGVAASSNGISGLGFEPIQNTAVEIDTVFYIGKLIHFNYPIYYPCLTLNMNLIFQIEENGNSIGTYTFTFLMKVNETLNEDTTGPCPFPTTIPCSDKITFDPNSLNTEESFTIGQVDYTITLQGFKESPSSTSEAITYFISNEEEASVAYLYASISAACPKICVNGGSYVFDNYDDCSCDCSGSTCPYAAETFAPNCSCTCPNPNQCNNGNGGTLTKECTCNCNACTAPQVPSGTNCGCTCPNNYCGAGTINDPNTCSCNCPTTPCSVLNQVRSPTCGCVCDLTCDSPFILQSTASSCDCVCPASNCGTGYSLNATNCQCECTLECPNSEVQADCTCGICQGSWTKNSDGQCTTCGLTAAQCNSPGEKLDTSTCQCVCDALVCNLYDGYVVNPNAFCACMNCTAGNCYCGNGVVEPGEQCDVGNATDPCCVQCQWTRNPCSDASGCTDNDVCNGAGQCVGNYNCAPSTTCNTVTCDTLTKQCVNTPAENGTTCGPTPTNLCQYRCISGTCQNQTTVCTSPVNLTQCHVPICQADTGKCTIEPLNSGSCSDGNACTFDDGCSNGVCIGKPVICAASTSQCQITSCSPTSGACVPSPIPNNSSCNADNNSCTVGDMCTNGRCFPGPLTTCNSTQCTTSQCSPRSGLCISTNLFNTSCNDNKTCTYNDVCSNGVCSGTTNSSCISGSKAPAAVAGTTTAVFAAVGAIAAAGAVVGAVMLARKVRKSKLLDPDTWNPEMISSVGANPLYKGSEKIVDNRLYEGGL